MREEDRKLQQHVIEALQWEPSVDAAHIGVTVRNGVVGLTGHVESYSEKKTAEQTARRVKGVKAIAEELEVHLPSEHKRADDEIAASILNVFRWDLSVPQERLLVKVERGWVTLEGVVDWNFQRKAAERDVRQLSGVVGITNLIAVKSPVQPAAIRDKIEQAFQRTASLDAKAVTITTEGSKVILGGTVHALHERELAENAAWSIPGVTQVEDRIAVL